MTALMDKRMALADFMEKYVTDKWEQDFVAINEAYVREQERINAGLISAFEEACRNAAKLQEQGLKGEIQYIHFSYLRTSIQENTSYYRIDAYDTNWFLDREECCSLWDASFIFQPLFERMNGLETKKAGYARKVTSMDIERIKQTEALNYHFLAIEFLRESVPLLLGSTAYQHMNKSTEISILAGEYIDQSEILYANSGTEG